MDVISAAMSDVASMAGCEGRDIDVDDETSISSRASSRIFDCSTQDNLIQHYTDATASHTYLSDDDVLNEPDNHLDNEYFDDFNLENIRSISQNITRNFGQPKNTAETENESDV